MKDYIISATAGRGQFRVMAAVTSETTEMARHKHNLYPTSADALGRVLTVVSLMSHTLKNPEDSLTVRVMGDGPLGLIIGVGDISGGVRGYVQNTQVNMPKERYGKFAFANAVGMGSISVSKDMGLKNPYAGSVPLTSGEIASDISEYYSSSEQLPTACGVGVYVGRNGKIMASGGFLVQRMPQATEEVAKKVEENVLKMPDLSTYLLDGHGPEDMVALLFDGLDYTLNEPKTVMFECNCSKEKYAMALSTIEREELLDMIEVDHGAETVCHFCNARYDFNEKELMDIVRKKKQS